MKYNDNLHNLMSVILSEFVNVTVMTVKFDYDTMLTFEKNQKGEEVTRREMIIAINDIVEYIYEYFPDQIDMDELDSDSDSDSELDSELDLDNFDHMVFLLAKVREIWKLNLGM